MLADALSYATVALGGAIFICISNLLANAVRGTGNMTLPAFVLIGCVLVHIALAPVLHLRSWAAAGAGSGRRGMGTGDPVCRREHRDDSLPAFPRDRPAELPGGETALGTLHRHPQSRCPGPDQHRHYQSLGRVANGDRRSDGTRCSLGYAMGARLEYILQPITFGFGTALVAMVGTNWGAGQYRRAREIAWVGGAQNHSVMKKCRLSRTAVSRDRRIVARRRSL